MSSKITNIKGLIGRQIKDCKETDDCVKLFSSKVNKSEEIVKICDKNLIKKKFLNDDQTIMIDTS